MMYITPTPTLLSPVPHNMIINNIVPIATPTASIIAPSLHVLALSATQPFLGLAGIPVVQQLTKVVVREFKLPMPVAPIVALVLGLAFNIGAAKILGLPLDQATVIGLGTTFGSGLWQELTTRNG